MKLFIQICAVFVGCMAFSLIYKVKLKRVIFCGIGASCTWLTYALTGLVSTNFLIISMVAAAFATIFAETFARITKAPTTIYLIPCILPLVPGGSLYYATSALVNGQEKQFAYFGERTLYTSLGISVGIIIVSISVFYFKQWRLYQQALILKKQKQTPKTK